MARVAHTPSRPAEAPPRESSFAATVTARRDVRVPRGSPGFWEETVGPGGGRTVSRAHGRSGADRFTHDRPFWCNQVESLSFETPRAAPRLARGPRSCSPFPGQRRGAPDPPGERRDAVRSPRERDRFPTKTQDTDSLESPRQQREDKNTVCAWQTPRTHGICALRRGPLTRCSWKATGHHLVVGNVPFPASWRGDCRARAAKGACPGGLCTPSMAHAVKTPERSTAWPRGQSGREGNVPDLRQHACLFVKYGQKR